MIKSVGQQNLTAAVELSKLRESGKARFSAVSEKSSASEATASSPASRMASEGAPIDLDRIAAIKAAIASGNYPVDPERIADRMLALDLPVSE
jgi:negative regulator of flagellin synthesis FlgM